MKLETLGEGYAIMIEVYEAGGQLDADHFNDSIKRHNVIVKDLQSVGLLEVVDSKGSDNKIYKLTDKGKEVSKELAQVWAIIQEV